MPIWPQNPQQESPIPNLIGIDIFLLQRLSRAAQNSRNGPIVGLCVYTLGHPVLRSTTASVSVFGVLTTIALFRWYYYSWFVLITVLPANSCGRTFAVVSRPTMFPSLRSPFADCFSTKKRILQKKLLLFTKFFIYLFLFICWIIVFICCWSIAYLGQNVLSGICKFLSACNDLCLHLHFLYCLNHSLCVWD